MTIAKKSFCSVKEVVKKSALTVNTAAVLAMTSVTAYAESLGVWQGAATSINSILTTLENALKSIVVPIAGVALIFCFIMMLISQNQKKVESYRAWVITIVICIVAIYAIPFIIGLAQQIGGTFTI